jgi:hypothetical protein
MIQVVKMDRRPHRRCSVLLARIEEASLRAVVNGQQARSTQLKIAQRLANELDATLVRRRDGTYYLRAGTIHGQIPIGDIPWPNEYNPDAVETAAYTWLSTLADALEAELLYDGKRMEWFLRWPDAEQPVEEIISVPIPRPVSVGSQ